MSSTVSKGAEVFGVAGDIPILRFLIDSKKPNTEIWNLLEVVGIKKASIEMAPAIITAKYLGYVGLAPKTMRPITRASAIMRF